MYIHRYTYTWIRKKNTYIYACIHRCEHVTFVRTCKEGVIIRYNIFTCTYVRTTQSVGTELIPSVPTPLVVKHVDHTRVTQALFR
jgi:hypothetical protein